MEKASFPNTKAIQKEAYGKSRNIGVTLPVGRQPTAALFKPLCDNPEVM